MATLTQDQTVTGKGLQDRGVNIAQIARDVECKSSVFSHNFP